MDNISKPIDVTDIRLKATGYLSFLMSCIRCGEQLSESEEGDVRKIIDELKSHFDADQSLRARLEAAEKVVSKVESIRKHPANMQGWIKAAHTAIESAIDYRQRYPKE